MDITDKDDETTKMRRLDVAIIAGEYLVSKYPTFFFFSPEGKLVSIKLKDIKKVCRF